MIVKKDTKCFVCGKPIKAGEDCELSAGRGYVCNGCDTTFRPQVETVVDNMFPDDECVCPLCKGTGRVNKILTGVVK